jgi:hypothetical protein
MADQQHPIARTERIVVDRVGDEVLVYDLDSDRAHSLDAVAAAIWRGCDGESAVATLAAQADVSEEVAWSTLDHLAEIDLLAEPLGVSSGHSRRALLRRGLIAGAAGVAAVPVIKSIVAPDPAAGGVSSCFGIGTVCTQSVQCCPGLTCCCEAPTCSCQNPNNCND